MKRGTYSPKGKEVSIAAKVFLKSHSKVIEADMVKEVNILGTLKNPHIVKFYGFIKKPGNVHLFLISELSLLAYVKLCLGTCILDHVGKLVSQELTFN